MSLTDYRMNVKNRNGNNVNRKGFKIRKYLHDAFCKIFLYYITKKRMKRIRNFAFCRYKPHCFMDYNSKSTLL